MSTHDEGREAATEIVETTAEDLREGDHVWSAGRWLIVDTRLGGEFEEGERVVVRRPLSSPRNGEREALQRLRSLVASRLNELPSVAAQDRSMLPEVLGWIGGLLETATPVTSPKGPSAETDSPKSVQASGSASDVLAELRETFRRRYEAACRFVNSAPRGSTMFVTYETERRTWADALAEVNATPGREEAQDPAVEASLLRDELRQVRAGRQALADLLEEALPFIGYDVDTGDLKERIRYDIQCPPGSPAPASPEQGEGEPEDIEQIKADGRAALDVLGFDSPILRNFFAPNQEDE